MIQGPSWVVENLAGHFEPHIQQLARLGCLPEDFASMRYFDCVTLQLRNETIVGLFQVEHQLSLQVNTY